MDDMLAMKDEEIIASIDRILDQPDVVDSLDTVAQGLEPMSGVAVTEKQPLTLDLHNLIRERFGPRAQIATDIASKIIRVGSTIAGSPLGPLVAQALFEKPVPTRRESPSWLASQTRSKLADACTDEDYPDPADIAVDQVLFGVGAMQRESDMPIGQTVDLHGEPPDPPLDVSLGKVVEGFLINLAQRAEYYPDKKYPLLDENGWTPELRSQLIDRLSLEPSLADGALTALADDIRAHARDGGTVPGGRLVTKDQDQAVVSVISE